MKKFLFVSLTVIGVLLTGCIEDLAENIDEASDYIEDVADEEAYPIERIKYYFTLLSGQRVCANVTFDKTVHCGPGLRDVLTDTFEETLGHGDWLRVDGPDGQHYFVHPKIED